MTKSQMTAADSPGTRATKSDFEVRVPYAMLVLLGLAVLMFVSGCQTHEVPFTSFNQLPAERVETVSLREGDILRISFPGAPNLNTTQQVRRDGKIALPLVGEIKAAGMAPAELEKEIAELYSTQLVSKEVSVAVESSTFPVFVTGAVIRPGKILSDRPITAIEAVMEAGGFDYVRADLKAVRVIRHDEGQVKNYTLNLKRLLEGEQLEPFYLKPSDIVYVPERFSWF